MDHMFLDFLSEQFSSDRGSSSGALGAEVWCQRKGDISIKSTCSDVGDGPNASKSLWVAFSASSRAAASCGLFPLSTNTFKRSAIKHHTHTHTNAHGKPPKISAPQPADLPLDSLLRSRPVEGRFRSGCSRRRGGGRGRWLFMR